MPKNTAHHCPCCGYPICLFRKLFFMDSTYAYRCPGCGRKIKIKRMKKRYIPLLFAAIILACVLDRIHAGLAWIVLIVVLPLEILSTYYAEILPADKDE